MAVLSTYAASTIKGRSYLPIGHATFTAASTGGQQLAVYLPDGVPADYQYRYKHGSRWPGVYVYINYSGFATSPDTRSSSSAATITKTNGHLWQMLARGIPVCVAQVTAPDNGTPPGLGYSHARGGTDRRWESNQYSSARKDAIHIIQYLRYYADYWHDTLTASGESVGWEPNIVMAGSSAGAITAGATAFWPNRAYELGTDAQSTMSTVPNAYVCLQACAPYIPRFEATAQIHDFPGAETGASAEAIATTIYDGPSRYMQEFSVIPNLASMDGECIPHTFAFTEEDIIGTDFTMPFVSPGDEASTGTENLHCLDNFLIMQSLFPKRFHLWGPSSGVSALVSNRFVGTLDSSEGAGQAGLTTGPIVDFVVEHIQDPLWDATPPRDGIRRHGQVETVGRYACPAHQGRLGTLIRNTSDDASAGPALADNISVGRDPYSSDATLGIGEETFIAGAGPVWIKAMTSQAKYALREVFDPDWLAKPR